MGWKILFILALILPVTKNIYGMSIPRKFIYVPADSITNEVLGRYIMPDFKNDTISIEIDSAYFTFKTKPHTMEDSFISGNRMVSRVNDSIKLHIQNQRLLSFTTDSLYIKTDYIYSQKFDPFGESGWKTDTIVIARADIKGVSYVTFEDNMRVVKTAYAGYGRNLKDKAKEDEKHNLNFNVIEIGYSYWKSFAALFGYSVYGANEFIFNSKNFLIGPKVGANIHLLFFTIGNEMICYTDFRKTALSYKPYVGMGFGALKITAGYNVFFYNKKRLNLNSTTINITIPFRFR